ncbi:sensor histidine kinase [Hymenobacter bucti]|uniref:histidine kinase n=1 Tax=Hymenobacter bucti TaxID=1844114 RepID=A0ABW4R1N5_9BACT
MLVAWSVSVLLSFGWARPAAAQVAATTPWVADSVLSSLVVRALVADDQGYLWVATPEGVRRYDGYQTVPLAQLLTSSQVAAPHGYINALVRDPAGCLWIGGVDGLYCWAGGTLTRRALPLGAANGTETEAVYALWLDPRTHLLWVGYSSGRVAVLDPARPPAKLPLLPMLNEQPSSFAAAPGGEVWLSTFNGQLYRLGAQGQRRQVYQQPGAYLVPVPGTPYVMSSQALYELNEATGTLRQRLRWLPASTYESKYFYPTLDAQGRPVQWLAQRRRLVVQWGAPGTLPQVKQLPVAFDATEPSTQYTLLQDARRLWWAFSPETRGCFKGGTAVPLRPLPVVGQVRPPSVRGLAQLTDGQLLMTTYSGVYLQRASYPTDTLRALFLTREGRPWPAMLYDVEVSATGRVLFADEANTFGELNPQTGVLTYYPLYPGTTDAAPLNGRVVYCARTGAVWGGATNGLYRLDAQRRQVTRYRTPTGTEPLRGQLVRSISEDDAGTLWLASEHGVYALNPTTGAVQHYSTAERTPNRHLPTDDVLCVYAPPRGPVWLGTATHGILKLVPGQGLVGQVSTEQGLPTPTVATLVPGAGGELWAGTYAGLVCYRPATGQLTIYGPAEGLANPELNKQAAYRAPDGTLYFGGVGGAFRVARGATRQGPDRPPHLLLTARASGSGALRFLPTPMATPTLLLSGPIKEGGFDLALNDYRAPALNRFFYQLRPAGLLADSAAGVQSTGRHLRLRSLDAGTYELVVWGQTPAGQRTPKQHLRVVVDRPWWQHPLLLLGAAGLLVGAGIGVQKLRGRRALREAQLRTRIAADLHDEVGALLTRVNLRAELLQEPASPDELTADMQALLLDSRAALLMMRDVVWSIDAGADTVGALRDRLHDHLDATAHAAGLHATLAVRGLPDAAPLAPQLRQHLYLIAKEAITNTVRHALTATHLALTLERQGGALVLTIQDDGPPQLTTTASGMGRRNMQRRAEALGGHCSSGPAATGWCVHVRVPYQG